MSKHEIGFCVALTLRESEKIHILGALDHFNGDKTAAAHSLGISLKTLYNKIHKYGEFGNRAAHPKNKSD